MVEFKPNYKVGPGGYLEEVLTANSISKEYLAYLTCVTINEIDDILENKIVITPETAEKFEEIFKIDKHIWLNMSKNYFEEV